MWIDNGGQVTTWINQRGWGAGIVPNWVGAGVTHVGVGDVDAGERIRFARVFGSGRADYVYMKKNGSNTDFYVWENQGAGGTLLRGMLLAELAASVLKDM